LNRFAFDIENRAPHTHDTRLAIEGLPPGPYRLRVGDHTGRTWQEDGKPTTISVAVPGNGTLSVTIDPLNPSAVP
jgi:hypothetical protein